MACVKWQLPDGQGYWVAEMTPFQHPTGAINTGEIQWDCGPRGSTALDEVEVMLEKQGLKLGDTIAWVTKKFGVKQCAPCKARQEILNHVKELGWGETLRQIKETF